MMGKQQANSRAPPSAPARPRIARTGRHRSRNGGCGRRARWNPSLLLSTGVLAVAVALAAAAATFAAGKDAGDAPMPPRRRDGGGGADRAPLRVFLLAGQSNMEGHGFVHAPPSDVDDEENTWWDEGDEPPLPLNGTLEWQLNADHSHLPPCLTMRTPPAGTNCRAEGAGDFSDLYDSDAGEWRTFPGVYVAFRGAVDRNGPLSVGYGLKSWWIGPEYGFGRTMGRYYKDGETSDVLLLKVAWGGTDLEYDWRPPRSGTPPPFKQNTPRPNWSYTNFTSMVHSALANDLEDLVPTFSYGRGDRYVLSGLGWHQGWNDGCSETEVADYGENMVNLIKDFRDEFDAPDLPVVIGTSGFGGWDEVSPRRVGIMKAQYDASLRKDLGLGSVAAVDTRGFWRSYDETHGAMNQCYHWYGNGETYYYVGTAMGEAMGRLLDGTWRQPPMNENGPGAAEV